MSLGWRRRAALWGVAIVLLATRAASADELPAPSLTPWQARAAEYATGVGVAAVTVPLSMELGALIGRSSPDLIAALVPSLLAVLLVPPAAVAGAEWSVGHDLLHRRVRFHPAIWAGVAVQAVAVLLGAVG